MSYRLSPMMYGSLRYILTLHKGRIGLDELAGLNQTQIRAFKVHQWIKETPHGDGVEITKEGRAVVQNFEANDQFFRKVSRLSFTGLLSLRMPGHGPVAVAGRRRSAA